MGSPDATHLSQLEQEALAIQHEAEPPPAGPGGPSGAPAEGLYPASGSGAPTFFGRAEGGHSAQRHGLGRSRCSKSTADARSSRSPGFGRLTPHHRSQSPGLGRSTPSSPAGPGFGRLTRRGSFGRRRHPARRVPASVGRRVGTALVGRRHPARRVPASVGRRVGTAWVATASGAPPRQPRHHWSGGRPQPEPPARSV